MDVIVVCGNSVRKFVMGDDGLISSVLNFASSSQFLCGIAFGLFAAYKFRRYFTKPDRHVEVESENLYSDYGGDIKMVIVVRSDLKMGKGKIAAQCAHAAVKAFRIAEELCPSLLLTWLENGEPKVVVRTESENDLLALRKAAQEVGLIAALIQDAGRTQIAPGSRTVLGVGPGPSELIDQVTGHLKLC
ncbi:peptidyl-tRNA hydrolase 2, mitochondrial-like [Schistocerca gregaria]|uniref:peptidyl-tRNA hydrolase 2, mitochondrial-like n=1 Tax=Schistocerca gregaria TaxID=7010 RepID=UPI00211DE618|nr:peptidyl-tRNA hydrolase 2, mitochondrial-like [Schistocerca gregaria]